MIPCGGLTPLSTVDWPERLSAVLYLRGCPWRCPYCHNPEFQAVFGEWHPWESVEAFLGERRGFLDGVVFSGGEPTAHAGLAPALERVRSLGFGIALHTGGSYPEMLRELLAHGLVDWVGFDVKAPFEDYELITGQPGSGENARRSLGLLAGAGVPFEIRTTVYPPVLNRERLDRMARQVGSLGAGRLVLQRCMPLRPASASQHHGGQLGEAIDLQALARELSPWLGRVQVRDAFVAPRSAIH